MRHIQAVFGNYKYSLFRSVKSHSIYAWEFIKLPDANVQPPDDYKWKWFGDALGALDGCHVDVSVPVAAQGRYRNRKQDVSTNMLGVVDWNMKFPYVLPGWEGSASDSRVLHDSMRTDRQDAFVVPHGMAYSLGFLFSLISYATTNLTHLFNNRKILLS